MAICRPCLPSDPQYNFVANINEASELQGGLPSSRRRSGRAGRLVAGPSFLKYNEITHPRRTGAHGVSLRNRSLGAYEQTAWKHLSSKTTDLKVTRSTIDEPRNWMLNTAGRGGGHVCECSESLGESVPSSIRFAPPSRKNDEPRRARRAILSLLDLPQFFLLFTDCVRVLGLEDFAEGPLPAGTDYQNFF